MMASSSIPSQTQWRYHFMQIFKYDLFCLMICSFLVLCVYCDTFSGIKKTSGSTCVFLFNF